MGVGLYIWCGMARRERRAVRTLPVDGRHAGAPTALCVCGCDDGMSMEEEIKARSVSSTRSNATAHLQLVGGQGLPRLGRGVEGVQVVHAALVPRKGLGRELMDGLMIDCSRGGADGWFR